MRKMMLGATLALLSLSPMVQGATLISHFPFDSDFTNSVSATLNSTPLNGTSLSATAAVGSGSASFDGVDDVANAGTNAVPGLNGGFYQGTVSLWLKSNSSTQAPGNRNFYAQTNGNPANTALDRMAMLVQSNAAGGLQMFLRAADGSTAPNNTNNETRFRHQLPGNVFPTTWNDGNWHHVAFSWRTNATGITDRQIYLDGQAVPTTLATNGLENDPTKSLLNPWESPGMFIGASNQRILQGGSATGHHAGLIDDLRVYDDFMTLDEIRQIPGVVPEPAALISALVGVTLVGRLRRRVS